MGVFVEGILSPQACLDAAAILAGQAAGGSADEAEALLEALGYRETADPGLDEPATMANRAALLGLAARLRRLFRITPPDAPNLVFLGGEADAGPADSGDAAGAAVSLAGAGLSLNEAFERCVGEGAEYLSQMGTEADIVCRGRSLDVSHGLGNDALADMLAMLTGNVEPAGAEFDWVAARCLVGGGPVRLPADLCLRRPESEGGIRPRVNVGTGCAGGPTEKAATMSAVLELVERDAAALWWKGGRPARPISLEVGAAAGADALLRHIRGGAGTRHSWLLDITTDLEIPCVASVSLTRDGDGFACGLAAGQTIGRAIRSAMVEMCQMELSHRVVAIKRRQRGDAALNRHDLAQIDRARAIDANTSTIQPKGLPNSWSHSPDGTAEAELSFEHLLHRLERSGGRIFAVDLTRDRLGIPVSKVIVTGLQPFPSDVETSRLKRTLKQHDSGNKSAQNVPLL